MRAEASGSGTELRARVCETQREKERIRKRKWDLKGSDNMVSVERVREREREFCGFQNVLMSLTSFV